LFQLHIPLKDNNRNTAVLVWKEENEKKGENYAFTKEIAMYSIDQWGWNLVFDSAPEFT
jgi:hypothetical protein